jgi:hypothetical protein
VRVIVCTICIAALLCICSCSLDPLGSGGTDYPNTFTVSGQVIDGATGEPREGADVFLIPEKYNPADEASGLLFAASSREGGDFSIAMPVETMAPGRYNLYGVFRQRPLVFIRKGLSIAANLALVPDTMRQPGTLRIILPQKVNVPGAYVYLPGTPVYRYCSSGTIGIDGNLHIVIDSMPQQNVAEIVYALARTGPDSIRSYAATAVAVLPGQTTVFNLADLEPKPQWLFPLVVGVTEKTVTHYGGLGALKNLVGEQMRSVEQAFAAAGVFKGVLQFRVDSVYQFSTSAAVEVTKEKPPDGFAFRIIYDQDSAAPIGSWYKVYRTVYNGVSRSGSGDLFSATATQYLVRAFALARGSFPQSWLQVKPENNPLNRAAFEIPSLTGFPIESFTWDTFTINAINYHESNFVTYPQIMQTAVPASLGVLARTSTGRPVAGARVELFPVRWYSGAVQSAVLLSGNTDSTGMFVFPINPFKTGYDAANPNNDERALLPGDSIVVTPNFLVRAVSGADTAYAWLPVTDAANAWFADHAVDFRKEVRFK